MNILSARKVGLVSENFPYPLFVEILCNLALGFDIRGAVISQRGNIHLSALLSLLFLMLKLGEVVIHSESQVGKLHSEGQGMVFQAEGARAQRHRVQSIQKL